MVVRWLVPVLMLGASGYSHAQDESQKIDLKHAASSTSAIVAELAKASKLTMSAAPSVTRDILYVNLHGVPVSEAMKRIASALHAEWRREGERYVLDRTPGLQAADERDEAARNALRLKKGIDKVVADFAKQSAWSDEVARGLVKTHLDAQQEYFLNGGGGSGPGSAGARLQSLGPKLPGGRAVTKLLSLMTLAQLERMSGKGRTVFSTQPNRMQVSMPAGSDAVIRQLLAEQRALDRAMKDAEASRDRSRIVTFGSSSPMEFEEGNPDRPGIAILRGGLSTFSGDAYFHLTVADVDGETITSGMLDVPLPASADDVKLTPSDNEKPIELSDVALRFSRALRSLSNGLSTSMLGASPGQPELIVVTQESGSSAPMPADLLERILNPDKYEPMALAPTEGLDAVAAQLGKNVVAYIPDGALLAIQGGLVGGKMKPTELLNLLQTSAGMTVSTEEGWIVATPSSPAAARRNQVVRPALAKALNTLVKQGYLSLDDLGEYATAQEHAPAFYGWDRASFMVINASSADHYFGYQNPWWLLRLYGMFSMPQKQALLSGQQIPIANFTAKQLELLQSEVMRGVAGVKIEKPDKAPKTGAYVSYPGLAEEVTIALPNGVTREGFIQVATTKEPAVQTMSSATGALSFLPFGGLAWTRINADRPDLTTAYGAGARADRYRMATKASHEFLFQFAPRVSLKSKLADVIADKNAQFGAYESLPADFRKMVEDASGRLKDMATEMSNRRTGAKPPR